MNSSERSPWEAPKQDVGQSLSYEAQFEKNVREGELSGSEDEMKVLVGPGSPEAQLQKEPQKFDVIADRLGELTEGQNPAEQLESMNGFIGALMQDVDRGGVKKNNGEGDPYSRDEIEAQLIKFVDALNNPTNEQGEQVDPLQFIPRSEGLRALFLGLASKDTAPALVQALTELKRNKADSGEPNQELSAEKQHGETVVEDLGDTALDRAGVESPSSGSVEQSETGQEVLSRLTEGLDTDDLLRLRGYANAESDKMMAQKDGNGEQSTDAQQAKGQYSREMSDAAKNIADRYARIYNSIS